MTVYVRNRRKVKVKQGFQSRVGCVQRVRAHIDSSQFSYEQGAVVRHAVRSTTIRRKTCQTWLKLRCSTV